jgi:tetratricopeptide (TPR) repeat protein
MPLPSCRKLHRGGRCIAGDDSQQASDSVSKKLNRDVALLSVYNNLGEFEKLNAMAAELAKQYPESKRLFFDRELALRAMDKYSEADALAEEMSKRLPEDTDVSRAFVYTAVAQEDHAAAHTLGEKLVAAGKAEANDLNSIAWNALFTGKVMQEDVDTAIKSAQLSQSRNAGILHTLGCVYAETGKTKDLTSTSKMYTRF